MYLLNSKSSASNIIKILLATLLCYNLAFAQDLLKIKSEFTPEPLPNIEIISNELDSISEKIKTLTTNNTNNEAKSDKILEQLNQQKLSLQQQLEIIASIKQAKESSTEILLNLNNINSEDHKKLIPKNFEESEKLRDEISITKESNKKTNNRLKNARASLELAKNSVVENEKSLKEITNSIPDELETTTSSNTIELKKLESKSAQQNLILKRLEVEYIKALSKKNSLYLKLLNKRLEYASTTAIISRSDFQRRLAQIEEAESKLNLEKQQSQKELEEAEKTFNEIKAKIEALPENSAGNHEIERLETASSIRACAQAKNRIIIERLQRLNNTKELWQTRYNNRLKNLPKETLLPIREKMSVTLERLFREKAVQLSELDETRKKISLLDDRLNSLENNSKQKVWIKDNKIAFEKLANAYDENLINLDSIISLHQNFLSESAEQVGGNNWSIISEEIFAQVSGFWNYELFASGDYPVTVGKLIFGIILIILGYFASDFLSRKLITKLLKRFNMTQGAIAAIQALAFYLFLIAFAIAALRIVNVPLTVFTFLGGALAIGVGFGSQNVMNNFISGLILLTEQPIRVGDMIEVDAFIGIVKKIGARSTIVRTGSNIDIVVPNSLFLEKNVINWTRNNSQARLSVAVGVDYNSNIELVSETLINAINENNKIITSPKPFVWFTGFGEYSLNFEIHFWANVRSATEKSTIESEIRYQIHKLFKENNIIISFPHRVLQSTKPLEIKLVGNNNV